MNPPRERLETIYSSSLEVEDTVIDLTEVKGKGRRRNGHDTLTEVIPAAGVAKSIGLLAEKVSVAEAAMKSYRRILYVVAAVALLSLAATAGMMISRPSSEALDRLAGGIERLEKILERLERRLP